MFRVKIVVLMVISMFLLATNGCPLYPAPVSRTGQTTSYSTGDDGEYQKGVAWPNPRFTDNGDGTVTDNLTGLIWLKDANCFSFRSWYDALSVCTELADGECELADGSNAGDWRLPNIKEFQSLIDFSNNTPALPTEHPFTNVQSVYWSSTTNVNDTSYAWGVQIISGSVHLGYKPENGFIWPVRGGH